MGVYQEVMETAKAAISTALEKDEEFASKVRLSLSVFLPVFP